VEPLPSFLGLTVVACAHCPSLHALRLGLWCGLGSGTPPQDILSFHSTLERQSLFESHRQRRWLTSWSYIQGLIREDLKHQEQERLEAELLKDLRSGKGIPMTTEA
jgi:hypothetical protein